MMWPAPSISPSSALRKKATPAHQQLDGSRRGQAQNRRAARWRHARPQHVCRAVRHGPGEFPISKVGVEVTDSPYVVANMRIMSRMGQVALERIGSSSDFVPGLHSIGDLDPMRRYIAHFPQEKLIWSVGSGYGGNALLGKKCFALRIASYMAREQGWMAEHMLILGLESPGGKVTYMGAAFPSACGKTNLAMMVSALEDQGYRVWTVGDDIAWMKIAEDGYLHAINPEAGFFGVAPGTGMLTNPNVMGALHKNTIFTMCYDAGPRAWWEGIGSAPPSGLINWKDEKWDSSKGPAAHPNSRYTVPANQSPSISPKWEAPEGVPISAFILAAAARVSPLLCMKPLIGSMAYSSAPVWPANYCCRDRQCRGGAPRSHGYAALLRIQHGRLFSPLVGNGQTYPAPTKNFPRKLVRRGEDGKFLWPGYGENVRVLKWILERVEGRAGADETPIGFVPTRNGLTLDGLQISPEAMMNFCR